MIGKLKKNAKKQGAPRYSDLKDVEIVKSINAGEAHTLADLAGYAVVELGRQLAKSTGNHYRPRLMTSVALASNLEEAVRDLEDYKGYHASDKIAKFLGFDNHSWSAKTDCGDRTVDFDDVYESEYEIEVVVYYKRKAKTKECLKQYGIK
jgi:hypothetical protein